MTDSLYESKLRNWDRVAAVRIAPRRLLADDESTGKLYFSPDLVPTVRHPRVVALGPEIVNTILIRRLYRYLDFTVGLEQNAVNPILTAIVEGTAVGLELPQDMVFDAFKIYCDEGYHSLFCVDLKYQVEARVKVPVPPYIMPAFVSRLAALWPTLPEAVADLGRTFFAIICETSMAALFSTIPRDERVIKTIREVIADHAEDEGRHHNYFCRLLEIWWPRLTPGQRDAIGPVLPQLVFAYLEPSYEGLAWELSVDGLMAEDVRQVIDDCFSRDQLVSRVRANGAGTLRLFERCGVLDDARTADAFHRSGLVG